MEILQAKLSRRVLSLGAAVFATNAALHSRGGLATGATPIENTPAPVSDPGKYDVYIPTACKTGPFYPYSCEFDASWAVLKTFGIDASFEEQLSAIRIDRRVEPYHQETADGFVIYGGDITTAYSGDYEHNFLARTTGRGMRRVFSHFGMSAARVGNRARIEKYLRAGRLIWIKITVDFRDWVPVTWITPEGSRVPGVLGNDHAMVVIGYNQDVVVIRDVLGPTSTNWERPYELEVSWDRFLTCWAAQNNDGLAVGPKATT